MQSRKAGLGFILVTLVLDILGIGLIVPILPRLLESFLGNDASAAARSFGLLTAAYATMQFIFSPVLGSVSDRFGRRPVLLVSLFGSGLDYLLLAWAPTLPWFFLGRILSGVSGASVGTAAAYIADVSPPEKRSQNFGLIGMAFGLGFVIGPLLGGLLGSISIRLPFVAAAGLTLANGLYGLLVLPESLGAEHRRPFSWARANPLGALASLARNQVVFGLSLAVFSITLAQRSLETIWVLYTEHRYAWGVRMTSSSLAVVGLASALVQGGLVRRVIPAWGERRSIVVGVSLAIVSFIFYGVAPQGWMLFVSLCIGALGGISTPAMHGLMSKAVSPSEQGLLQGGLSSLGSLTLIVGPLIATQSFGYFISPAAPMYVPGAPFFLGAVLLGTGLLLALRTFRHVPRAPQQN